MTWATCHMSHKLPLGHHGRFNTLQFGDSLGAHPLNGSCRGARPTAPCGTCGQCSAFCWDFVQARQWKMLQIYADLAFQPFCLKRFSWCFLGVMMLRSWTNDKAKWFQSQFSGRNRTPTFPNKISSNKRDGIFCTGPVKKSPDHIRTFGGSQKGHRHILPVLPCPSVVVSNNSSQFCYIFIYIYIYIYSDYFPCASALHLGSASKIATWIQCRCEN